MPITAYLQLIKPLLLNADIHKTVQFLFLQYQWSPEKISFRLKHEKNPIQISYATIEDAPNLKANHVSGKGKQPKTVIHI